MEPTLHNGELILFRQIRSNEIQNLTGEVVVLKNPLGGNSLIVKRVKRVIGTALELRGDNKNMSTDSRQFGLVNSNLIQGVVKFIIK